MPKAKQKSKPKEKRLHFAGYDFTSGPEGTVVHRPTPERAGFQPGDRVKYDNVNLWDEGTVTSSDGKWVMVRWDGKSFESREWAPNLRHVSTGSRHHATKSSGVRAVGGPYTVYYERAGGEPVKTSATTKQQAIRLACATSKMTGGYVTVNRKGIEVAACYGGEVVESKRHHATKKSPAQLQREINEALAKPIGIPTVGEAGMHPYAKGQRIMYEVSMGGTTKELHPTKAKAIARAKALAGKRPTAVFRVVLLPGDVISYHRPGASTTAIWHSD